MGLHMESTQLFTLSAILISAAWDMYFIFFVFNLKEGNLGRILCGYDILCAGVCECVQCELTYVGWKRSICI